MDVNINMNSDKYYDFLKICRLCLQSLDLSVIISVFSTDYSIVPQEMIIKCANIQIFLNDGLPSNICNDCFYKLGIAYEFRNRCEASDKKLREYLEKETLEVNHSYNDGYEIIPEVHKILANVCESNHLELATDTTKKSKNSKKIQPIKTREKLNGLLSVHKEKLKQENAKIKIFKQKRNSKKKTLSSSTEQSSPKRFECEFCNKTFTQSGNLKLHIRTHSGERKYQCELCSSLFTTSSNLQAHTKIHTSTRDFGCSTCPLTFKTSAALSCHEKTHSTEKPFVCAYCQKRFTKKSYLNGHINTVHNGMKKYKCKDCGKLFSSSSNLIVHNRMHSGEKPFECKICQAKFSQSSALNRHNKQHSKVKKDVRLEDSRIENIPEAENTQIVENPPFTFELPQIEPLMVDLFPPPLPPQIGAYELNYHPYF